LFNPVAATEGFYPGAPPPRGSIWGPHAHEPFHRRPAMGFGPAPRPPRGSIGGPPEEGVPSGTKRPDCDGAHL
jgi:hypothetical protein